MTERLAPARTTPTAVVLGGSLAGLLAARALAEHANVTVIERDTFPKGPQPRKGLPQAQHVHLFWSGGADAVERLLPGTTHRLTTAGAHRLALPTHMVAYSPRGWFRRWAESHYMILCSRDLLDWTVREQVLAGHRITVLEGAEVLGLTGDAAAVTGARVRTADGADLTVSADLVVDATGRTSRAPEWLTSLGTARPAVREVDAGLVYASRIYQAPRDTWEHFPAVLVQADPRVPGPGQAGGLVPIEGGRWLCTMSGTRGGEPTKDAEAFEEFARRLRDPIVGELLAQAQPLTDVVVSRSTINRRHFYEKIRNWPEGFLVTGDAVAAYNPVYGHGMSVAAQSALAMRKLIRQHGWGTPGLARRIQKAVARPVSAAWDLATGQDVFYPGATESGPTLQEKLQAGYVNRLIYTSTGNGRVARTVTDVITLQKGSHVLVKPSMLLAAAIGPLRPQLTRPPLTAEELKASNA
ncbi:FAD-dependent monooxygenase [Streptomyces sp. NBC_01142]|uniref:FAD-dependent monooxygenase n=1 Tax=Streptomyces sp. NBC_01142 TaxID=2975865 RepID=UPI0022514AD8|nr:FAD-dependent monooxygenase [Streptomyces sp. NBC_01142]MCX4825160.1 FAD-dependent monooxygenase [Streptomyces sp. NBC_01142]